MGQLVYTQAGQFILIWPNVPSKFPQMSAAGTQRRKNSSNMVGFILILHSPSTRGPPANCLLRFTEVGEIPTPPATFASLLVGQVDQHAQLAALEVTGVFDAAPLAAEVNVPAHSLALRSGPPV